MTIQQGGTLSHYLLLEKIGEGGMGVVWRALDTKLNRQVAIKILPSGPTSDAERLLRFQREAQAAAALNHPHIATVHEVSEHDGVPFIVMELVEGRSLREILRQGPLSPDDWVRIGLSVAEALAHAHNHGVIHRDLKPDNVRITPENHVKLLDFGLAKLLEPETPAGGAARDLHSRLETISRELTRAGKVFGTVAYMSPEQARGEPVDHRTDVFSFGIMLYEMATDRLPFKGGSDIETLHAVISEEPPPLSDAAAGMPPEADRVVRKAMEKEPARRYQHADDLAADLRNLQRDLDSGRASIATGPALRRRPSRRARWIAASALGLAAVLAVTAYRSFRRPPAPTPDAEVLAGRAIAVMGFEDVSHPDDADHLGRSLMGLITTDLAESGGLKVISTSKVLAALEKSGAPGAPERFRVSAAPEAARNAGARIMLVGQVSHADDRMILAAELVDVESGNTLGSIKKEAGSRSQLFSLAGAIAGDVRRKIGVPAQGTSSQRFDLARAITSSPEAYGRYAMGEVAFHQGRFAEASEQFDAALKADPGFALAYYRRGVAQWWSNDVNAAAGSLRKGLPHLDRLPDRWRILYRGMLDLLESRTDAAWQSLSRLTESETDIPDAFYLMGELATHVSRYHDPARAREMFEKALDLDPAFRVVLFHLFLDYLWMEDLEAAERMLAQLQAEIPGDPMIPIGEASLLWFRGQDDLALAKAEAARGRAGELGDSQVSNLSLLTDHYDRAYAVADEKLRKAKEPGIYLAERGMAQIGRGRLREGLADIERATDHLVTASWLRSDLSALHVIRSKMLGLAGRMQDSLAAAQEAIRLDPFSHFAYFWMGCLQLSGGRIAEARGTLTQLRQTARDSVAPSGPFWVHLLQAELDLAEGRISSAVSALEEASSLAPQYRDASMEALTRAHVKAASGDLRGAIAAYQEMFGARWHFTMRWPDVMERVRALYAVARLEEESGDREGAKAHYRAFLARWGHADMPVKEVQAAASRLAALGPP